MKRRWLVVTLLVGALAVGILGGTALAQEDDTSGSSPVKSFAARVAAILGLDEAQVQDAFNQAARETQDEALQQRLDTMVEKGKITQEQADEYYGWYQSRPESLTPGLPFGKFGGHGFHRGGMGGGWGMMRGGMMGRHGMNFEHCAPPAPVPEGTQGTSS